MSQILSIGSIVYLSEGNQKMMILNRGAQVLQNEEEVFFDYTGAVYPQGLDPEQVYYFNNEDIDKVVFEGYVDDDEKRFAEIYEKWLTKNAEKIKKGSTEPSNRQLNKESVNEKNCHYNLYSR